MQHKRWTVLLVDDTVPLRLLLKITLERTDRFEVVGEAGDGRTAIALAHELDPDLIVLDLNMPVMDGFEAFPQIRAASPTSRVVIFSGLVNMAVKTKLRGASAYIVKGTSAQDIVTIITGVMETARAETEAN